MADIRKKLLNEYKIDIEKVNLLQLYKLEKHRDASQEELEDILRAVREKWEQNRYSTNEKLAKRAEENLKGAEQYEKILKNPVFREELWSYYSQKGKEKVSLDVPREFFQIVGTTRQIKRNEIIFFLEYFQEYKKHKKTVFEMLEKEFHVSPSELNAAGKKADKAETSEEAGKEEKGRKKKKSSVMEDLFGEDTLLKLHSCELFYSRACGESGLVSRYPELGKPFHQFLRIEEWKNLEQMAAYVDEQRAKASSFKYEGVQEASVLMDLFNTVSDLLKKNDVSCNFHSFKLLVEYPALTPYMHEFLEAKESTVRGLYGIAARLYGFQDEYDFILTYFAAVYANFGIYDEGIKKLLKEAKKQNEKEKIRDTVDKALGRDKTEPMSLVMQLVFILVNLPLYGAFWVFELVKFIVWNLRYMGLIAAAAITAVNFGKIMEFMGIRFGRTGFDPAELANNCYQFFVDYKATVPPSQENYWAILGGLLCFTFLVVPALCVGRSLWNAATILRKSYDWKGIERTFHTMFNQYKKQMKNRMRERRGTAVVGIIFAIAINLAVAGSLAWWKPDRLPQIKWETVMKWGARDTQKEKQEKEEQAKKEAASSAANIRSGPGTDYEVVAQAREGEFFEGTGEVDASGERIWYQIYLDDSCTDTGWVSEKVVLLLEP